MTEIPFLINPAILRQIDGFETLTDGQIEHANLSVFRIVSTDIRFNRFYEANRHRSFLGESKRLDLEKFDADTGSWATPAEEFSA
jgi:hypothetical protein